MKIVLEIKNKPVKGDILVMEDIDTAKCISKISFLKDVSSSITDLNCEINRLKERISILENEVTVLKGE